MAWTDKLFAKRDFLVLLAGMILMQALVCLSINRFMFHPVKGGYDRTIDGFVELETNSVLVAARIIKSAQCKKVLLYCHGNAEDITSIDDHFDGLLDNGYAVATFDYPGYGLSEGLPDEAGCYRNAHRIYDWLRSEGGFQPKNIFVAGYSIGTGVAIELAETCDIGGLWLEAAYLSAPRIVTRFRFFLVNPFPNSERIQNVKCPIVMLHGKRDSIIPYSQSEQLYGLAPEPKWFIPVEDANHADFINHIGRERYKNLLCDFLENRALDGESFK